MEVSNLYPFQCDSVARLITFLTTNVANAAYLGSDMGTGKTPVSIVTANRLQCEHILVTCPAIMRSVWQEEIDRWSNIKRVQVLYSRKDIQKLNLKVPGWIVVSYSLAANVKVLKALHSKRYDLLIMDESIALKNHKTLRARAVLVDLWKRAEYKLALCGTPITNSVTDIYTLAQRMAPNDEDFASFKVFAEKYSYQRDNGFAIQYYGLKNGEQLKKKIRKYFFHRVSKVEALPELPEKTWQLITLPKSLSVMPDSKTEQGKLLLEIESVKRAIENDKPVYTPKCVAENRRLQGEAKVEAAIEFITPIVEAGTPLVVFFYHRNVGMALETALKKWTPAYIAGDTPPGMRAGAIAAFQKGETNLFLGSIPTCGMGITLTRSSTVLFVEGSYSPAEMRQAADRCHRIGTKSAVTLYLLTVASSIDNEVNNVLLSKLKVIDAVV